MFPPPMDDFFALYHVLNASLHLIVFKLTQFANMLANDVTFDMSKLERSSILSFEHPANIEDVLVSLGVLNDERLRYSRPLHSWNIICILVTDAVLNDFTFSSFSDEQDANMLANDVAEDVLKVERSNDSNDEQLWNI